MSHLDSHNVPRRRIKLDVSTRKHAFTRVRARVTAFSSARSSSRPFPRRRCVFAKYGRSGGVRVCLSRPAVSKANDLPWNLDNLSARLQPVPRSGGLHLFRGAPLVPSLSLSRSFSLADSLFLLSSSIHPSRFKPRLPTAPRVSRPFTYRSPLHTADATRMNGNQTRNVSPTTGSAVNHAAIYARERVKTSGNVVRLSRNGCCIFDSDFGWIVASVVRFYGVWKAFGPGSRRFNALKTEGNWICP